jgi:hypothetical protein
MIDQMIRCKNLDISDKIECLHQWFEKCPPQGKEKHWVDGRSAKETAKHWAHTLPSQFLQMLNPFKLDYKICSPEYVSDFDLYRGNGRNHDLLILAENDLKQEVVISIESKVDEPFDVTIAERISAADIELINKPNSKAKNRVEDLRVALFGNINVAQLSIRYQLLAGIAGLLAEAKKRNAKTAIFLVQTFVSSQINVNRHYQNQCDLGNFINLLSNGIYSKITEGIISGPIRVPGDSKLILNNIDLWIGQYMIPI